MLEKIKKILKPIAKVLCIFTLIFAGKVSYKAYIYQYKGNSVVYMLTGARSGGTGFQVIAPSGNQYTITNRHICKGKKFLKYVDEKENTGMVKVIEISKTHDLCILEPIEHLPALDVASKLYPKEEVHLLGHPSLRPLTWERGYFIGFTHINLLSKCSVTYAFHEKSIINYNGRRYCAIRISANMFNNNAYGGNSGSPMLDFKGDVIGVLYAGSPSQPDISYAVPLFDIQQFLKDY